ncbi:hypothetical protein AGMMS50256_20410 [Betaproteobacteria bacterium]|nr:hypothetical protein AGMMS50256_20410 [Betaproteobacteria bacterium]
MTNALLQKSDGSRRFSVKEVVSGLLVIAVGLAFLIGSYDLDFGSPEQMGPGFFPVLAGGIVVLTGLGILLSALGTADIPFQKMEWRPMIAIIVSLAVFTICLRYFGLIPAVMGCIITSALGDRTSRLYGVIILAVVGSVGSWLIFSVGLGLTLYAFKGTGG